MRSERRKERGYGTQESEPEAGRSVVAGGKQKAGSTAGTAEKRGNPFLYL